jgi:prepilin-type N-terminal cleavage/methylation domain-containing protein
MKHAFTLIEVVIAVSLIAVLAGIGFPLYRQSRGAALLNESATRIVQDLRTARAQSTSGLNNSTHGVYFESNANDKDRMVIYEGASYAVRNSTLDRVTVFESILSVSTSLLGGEVVYDKSSGAPSAAGTITLTHSALGSRTISINALGIVDNE